MKVRTVKVLEIAAIALLLAGCGAKAQEMPASDNSGVRSEADSSGDISASSSEATADKELISELISEDEAKNIALKDAGLTEEQVSGLWCKLDTDDGKVVYEVSIVYKEKKYEFEISADSGKILEWEEEPVS